MEPQLNQATSQPKRYNPRALRRQMRKNGAIGDCPAFQTKSYTRDEKEFAHRHHVVIDAVCNTAHCTCEDAQFRHHSPDLTAPVSWCKHIADALAQMEREGRIPKLADRQAKEREAAKERVATMTPQERDAMLDSF